MSNLAAYDLGLHCLPRSQKWNARHKRVKNVELYYPVQANGNPAYHDSSDNESSCYDGFRTAGICCLKLSTSGVERTHGDTET